MLKGERASFLFSLGGGSATVSELSLLARLEEKSFWHNPWIRLPWSRKNQTGCKHQVCLAKHEARLFSLGSWMHCVSKSKDYQTHKSCNWRIRITSTTVCSHPCRFSFNANLEWFQPFTYHSRQVYKMADCHPSSRHQCWICYWCFVSKLDCSAWGPRDHNHWQRIPVYIWYLEAITTNLVH